MSERKFYCDKCIGELVQTKKVKPLFELYGNAVPRNNYDKCNSCGVIPGKYEGFSPHHQIDSLMQEKEIQKHKKRNFIQKCPNCGNKLTRLETLQSGLVRGWCEDMLCDMVALEFRIKQDNI